MCVYYFSVNEVKKTMDNISASLSSCVRLVRKLNSLLPEEDRLEKFKLHPELEEDSDDDEDGATGRFAIRQGGRRREGEEREREGGMKGGGGGERERERERLNNSNHS